MTSELKVSCSVRSRFQIQNGKCLRLKLVWAWKCFYFKPRQMPTKKGCVVFCSKLQTAILDLLDSCTDFFLWTNPVEIEQMIKTKLNYDFKIKSPEPSRKIVCSRDMNVLFLQRYLHCPPRTALIQVIWSVKCKFFQDNRQNLTAFNRWSTAGRCHRYGTGV